MENMDGIIRTYLTRIIPRPALFFDVSLCDHCNLNCKGCGSFAPLAKESFLDLEDYIKDAKRLSKISGGVVHHINILGGEPLLHPQLLKFIKVTREQFPIGNINLVTNGILLLKMSDKFWETMREYDILLAPTKYPVQVNYVEIEKKALEMGVRYKYFGDATIENSWIHNVITEQGDRNELHSFLVCGNANNCAVLKNGKIYPCPRSARIELFNDYFNTDFKLTNKDYIDIYDDISIDDIMNFLAKPIPFCKYCNRFANTKTNWGISKKNIKEWT